MPQLAKDCIASWHKFMPDWEYILWNEDNFDVNSIPYVKEAYESRKYAFVSDYVRLFALKQNGGIYLDTDVEVFKSFDDLLDYPVFAGYEGSKKSPIATCVIGSEPQGQWVSRQLGRYDDRHFRQTDGSLDTTTNVEFITSDMINHGLICDGSEQDACGLHIFPVDYFCPMQTTGEYLKTERTFCDHKEMNSWGTVSKRPFLLRLAGPKLSIKLIKLKRKLFG